MKNIILDIDGMKCSMCESHINDIIRQNFKVKKVKSSHIKNNTIITTQNDLDMENLKQKLFDFGYKTVSVKTEEVQQKCLFKSRHRHFFND